MMGPLGFVAVSERSWSVPKVVRKSGCAAIKKDLRLPLSMSIRACKNCSPFLFFAIDQPNQHSLALRDATENIIGECGEKKKKASLAEWWFLNLDVCGMNFHKMKHELISP